MEEIVHKILGKGTGLRRVKLANRRIIVSPELRLSSVFSSSSRLRRIHIWALEIGGFCFKIFFQFKVFIRSRELDKSEIIFWKFIFYWKTERLLTQLKLKLNFIVILIWIFKRWFDWKTISGQLKRKK